MQMKDGNHCLVGCFSVNWDLIVSFIELETLPGLVVSPWLKERFSSPFSYQRRRGFKRGWSGESLQRSYLGWDDRSGTAR